MDLIITEGHTVAFIGLTVATSIAFYHLAIWMRIRKKQRENPDLDLREDKLVAIASFGMWMIIALSFSLAAKLRPDWFN